MKTRVIAISSISAAFIAIFLTIGAYIQVVDVVSVVLSSLFVMLPLYYKSYLGSVLSAISGCVIAFLCSGFNIFSVVFPSFLLFFGIYPIVKCKTDEKQGRNIIYTLYLVWCVAICYGIYYFWLYIANNPFENLPVWLSNNIILFVGLFGVLIFFLYDRFIFFGKRFLDKNLGRILKDK